jgi:hypothetical protein
MTCFRWGPATEATEAGKTLAAMSLLRSCAQMRRGSRGRRDDTDISNED